MNALKQTLRDFFDFIKITRLYAQKRLRQGGTWFETHKSVLVNFLVARRGSYQRPFLHTSLFMIVGVGIVGAPIIANTYPTIAADQLAEYTPPSAVLSSFDEAAITTEKSERPRDASISYQVTEGDTLAKIAEKFDVSIDTIKWANDLKGENLSINQELQIPPVTGVVVKVKKGETVYSIAKKYQTDPQKIVNWPFNDYTDIENFSLAAGQTLVVPDGVMPESKPVYSPQTIANVGTITGNGQFIWPTQGMITQRPVSYHMAVDIANNVLPPVVAADAGKVVLMEKQRFGYGWHVILDHGNGYQTLYGHMSDIYVSVGQNVSKGSVIGKMGSTGRSTGPHLHFEIRKNGALLNPLNFYSK